MAGKLDEPSKQLLAEFARGSELIFENAEQLYKEACILRDHGALSRALCLHQLSNEECGKLELLGGAVMSVVMGHPIKLKAIEKAFSDHKAKNHANAYYAAVTGAEKAARERGDWAGAREAFAETKEVLHELFNRNKNASLYVDFRGGKFSAPKDAVTMADVVAINALNAYLLNIVAPYVRLAHRVATDDFGFQQIAPVLAQRLEAMPIEAAGDVNTHLRPVLDEMLEILQGLGKIGTTPEAAKGS